MKILHFKRTMRAEDGGVVKAVLDLCACTVGPDLTATLATADASAVPDSWRTGSVPGIDVRLLEGPGRSADRLGPEQLAATEALVRAHDVVHLHSMWSGANIQVAALCHRLGVPYILSVHGMLDDWCMAQRRLKKVLFLHTFNRGLMRHTSAVHCTAQAELEQASKWFDPRKGVVAPLPLDLEPYRDLPDTGVALRAFDGLDPAVPIVLFLSRIHYKKGLDRLLRASALLEGRGVAHQLVIAGTGEGDYPEQMRRMADELGVMKHTRFVGFASGEPKVALLRLADIFALPTSQENFGFVYFESLAAGTPVLTTKGTDTWPELEASGAGIIADNTPERFAEQLARLLADRAALAERGGRGRSWVFEHLAPAAVRDSYLRLYADAAGKGAR